MEENLFQKMSDLEPDKNPIFTAISNLKTVREIRLFMHQYEEWMLTNADASVRGKEVETARRNVGYILGYYGDKTRSKWYSALPDVSHPVFGYGFGRGKEVTPEEAFAIGVEMGQEVKRESERKTKQMARWEKIDL